MKVPSSEQERCATQRLPYQVANVSEVKRPRHQLMDLNVMHQTAERNRKLANQTLPPRDPMLNASSVDKPESGAGSAIALTDLD